MSNFVTDPLWTEEPQPELAPAHAGALRPQRPERKPVATENQAERLQRIAGNAALAREAEEALALKAKAKAEEAPRKPAPKPEAMAKEAAPKPKMPEKPDVKVAAKPVPRATAVPEEKVKAAARASALATVLGHFERDAAHADLVGLARLCEDAPSGIAEGVAHTLAQAVMRADPAQRAAIALRFRTQLGDRQDLKLAKLLAGRLAFLATPSRAAPPPPPPPAPPD